MDQLPHLIALSLAAGTPLMLAALGELVTEKSGVLNLGVEGMMAVGAVSAFIVAVHSGSPWLGVAAGAAAGILLALLFAFIVLSLMANQVASGLALSLFGVGLASFVGRDYVAQVIDGLPAVHIAVLSDLPVVGELLFSLSPIVYLSLVLFALVQWALYRSRAGLIVRAVGESPQSAYAIGLPVVLVRYLCVAFGGACSGLAGAYLAVVYTPLWAEGMISGRGWIAVALVVFATWKPWRALAGAYLFGFVTLAQFQVQAWGTDVPPQFLSSLPYLATIIVLTFISRDALAIRLNAPASLGKPFHPGD